MKILFSLLSAATTFAALPPLAQSSKEIEAIITHPKLENLLGSAHSIEQIVKEEDGYQVFTSSAQIFVQVVYTKSSGKIGPISFDLVFHEPVRID